MDQERGVDGDSHAIGEKGFVSWFQTARAISCLAVVWYHVVGGLGFAHAPDRLIEVNSNFDVRLRNVLPVFFFLSGVLAARQMDRSPRAFVRTNLSRLAYPYVLWSVASVLISVYVARDAVNRQFAIGDLARIGWRPVLQYWYLLALLLYLLIFRIIRQVRLSNRFVLVPAALGYVLVVLDVAIDAYFPRMAAIHGGYMALGIVGGERIVRLVDTRTTRQLAAVGALGIGAIALIAWPSLTTSPSGFASIFGGYLVLAAVLCCAAVIGRRWPDSWLHGLGGRTLAVYVGHVIAAAAVRIGLIAAGITAFPVLLAAGLAAGVCLPLALETATRRFRIPFVFSLDQRLRAG